MSIFSRKGADTPEPVSVPLVSAGPPKQMSEKQRSWLSRRRSSSDDPTSPKHGRFKSPRGTVLHAVPPASVIRLSALEEEMAQSPNAEILSAISDHATTPRALASPFHSLSSEQQESPNRYSSVKGTGRGASSSTIGIWVDGVVHWNEDQAWKTTESIPTWQRVSGNTNGQKPSLSVLIPNSEVRPYDCTIYQPQPHRPSSLMMPIRRSGTPPLERPHAPLRKQSLASRVSRSSTTSSSSVGEEASICSNRSSTTSIEAPVTAERRKSHTSLHGLPPMPPRAAPCPPVNHQSAHATLRLVHSDKLLHPQDMTSRSPYAQNACIASPTWSQAEHDLQRELSTNSEERAELDATRGGSIRRSGSVREVMQPPSRAPTIPKRSRKRDWRTRVAYPASELQRRQSEMQQKLSGLHDVDVLRKSVSVSYSANPITTAPIPKPLAPQPPERSTRRPVSNAYIGDGELVELHSSAPASRRRDAISAAMTPTVVAEDVLLHILARLYSPQDLFNTAIVNKGMYRVYKENELHLLRTAVYNESPASWELREWSPPDRDAVESSERNSELEHSPLSYISSYRHDGAMIERLKRLILERCQSFLRRETVFALSTPTHPNAPRFNDAFWRIWTFCQIFGYLKNREDDITGQMDWLKGGVLANNEDCIASTEPNMDFDMRSVLISPPACFAEGNKGGLNAGQLVDMTEIWTCMTVLLQSYHGRVGQARFYGVFDQCEVETGDIEGEEMILEEWTAYLMTLGPKVVLEMAQLYPAAGFALAKDNGWTRWAPPIYNGSRTSFLKEPVAKSYEEQMIVTKQHLQDPHEQGRKDASRRRVATLAAEIRLRRQSSAFKRAPLIDMTTERAMSISSRRDSVSPTRTSHSRGTTRRTSAPPTILAPRDCHAIAEHRVETRGHRNGPSVAKDTGERAIQQLVMMGFEREMAIDALRITDRGDCLRPDRAIDLLLRQQE